MKRVRFFFDFMDVVVWSWVGRDLSGQANESSVFIDSLVEKRFLRLGMRHIQRSDVGPGLVAGHKFGDYGVKYLPRVAHRGSRCESFRALLYEMEVKIQVATLSPAAPNGSISRLKVNFVSTVSLRLILCFM